MVQVVGGHYLVLHALVVHFDGMLSVVTAEHKEVLYGKLLCFRPSDLEPSLLQLSFAFQRLGI